MKPSNLLLPALAAVLLAAGALWWFSRSAESATPVKLEGLFSSVTVRGAEYAPETLALRGKPVEIEGFAAADPAFPDRFVVTRARKTLCSPCGGSADYPASLVVIFPEDDSEPAPVATDSVFVYLNGQEKLPETGQPVRVTGRLQLEQSTDDRTRFSSLAQLQAANWRAAQP